MRVLVIGYTTLVSPVPGYLPHRWPHFATDADELAEMAGRLCYESWDRPNAATATNAGYIANIQRQQHYSVLEHGSATIYIDGVTRNFSHELVRHRHFSFSEVSQRYVDAGEFPFIVHPGLAEMGAGFFDDDHEGGGAIESARSAYRTAVDTLAGRLGFERKKARQAARHLLPGGTETKILVTGNHRAWRELLGKRLSPAADEEFRRVAALILAELKNIAPATYQDIEVPA